MKRLLIALLLLAVHPIAVQAQSNYKPGLVVTMAGDTLKGFVNYQEWNETPTAIQYAASSDGNEKREFDAQTAQFVEITGFETYRRYSGPVTMNELDIRKLTSDRNMQVTDAQLFLKEISKGENITLFSYTDRIKTRFFVQENNSSLPQELYYVKYYTSGAGNKVFNMKSYVGQLLIMAGKYVTVTPALKREIESADYDGASFQSIINKINGKSATALTSEAKQKNKPRFYAGIGLNRINTKFRGANDMAKGEGNPTAYVPRIAFGLDAFVNRNTQKLLLRMEGSLTSSNQTVRNNAKSSTYDYRYTYEISQQTASLTPQVIYNFYSKENLKVYAGCGFSVNYSNYSKNKYTTTYSTSTNTYGPEELPAYKLEPVWSSFVARTGVVLNGKYEVSVLYQPATKLTKYTTFAIEQQVTSIGLNYLFGK